MQKRVHALAIQSYDWISRESGQGSRARIRAACDLIAQGRVPADCLVLWPQGYQKKDPDVPVCPGQESLGWNMARFARRQHEMRFVRQLDLPTSWGTMEDIQACYRMIEYEGYENAHIYFVSDKVHLRRVKLVWWMTHPKGWTAEFHEAPHSMTTFERYVREPLALLMYSFMMLPQFVWEGRMLSRV